MCTGAEAASVAAIGANGAGTLFGGQAQAKSARDQQNMTMDMFKHEDQLRANSLDYLKQHLPQFNFDMPDVNKYFGTDGINQQYNIARGNLNNTMNQSVSDASSQAGALGASRGFANPSGFVQNSANQVRQSFFPQFGALEQNRAGALQGNQAQMFQALMGQLGQQNQMKQNEFQNYFNIQQHRLGA